MGDRKDRPAQQGEMTMKPIVIGIMPQDKIRERALAIARGEHKPKPGEPRIWFTSMKSLAEVLSDDNRALIRVIAETRPGSISELAEATGRKPSNLSRTLKTMSRYGIVELQREKNHVRPVAKATEFRIVAA
jgi:predicted transcriptional regulator